MMRPEGMAIDNENGNQGVQNVPSFSQRESEGKQQQQQEPLIQPIRGTNKQLQRQQQLLAQKQLQQQQHEHQHQQQLLAKQQQTTTIRTTATTNNNNDSIKLRNRIGRRDSFTRPSIRHGELLIRMLHTGRDMLYREI